MESFEDRLKADAEYKSLNRQCQYEAWEIGGEQPSPEWYRLCELREARYMALKREWEAGQ